MADVSKIFKPRRGKVSTMLGTKASTVLAAGEMFFEVPDTGVGTGRGRIMMGDGSTTYVNLAGANNNTGANSQAAKYFMPFTQDEIIVHPGTDTKSVSASSSIRSSTVATYLNNAKSGNTLKSIIHNLRQAIYTNACDIAMLNNEYNDLNSDLNSLNTSLTNRLGTDIPLYDQGGIWYCRKNGICTIGFEALANTAKLQLPDGMKPKGYVSLYGQSPTNSYMVLDTDGILHYYASATHKLFGTVSYPALDA